MNKTFRPLKTLLKDFKLHLPGGASELINQLVSGTDTTTKSIAPILHHPKLSALEKQKQLEALLFESRVSKDAMKYALSQHASPFLEELTTLMAVSDPNEREPRFVIYRRAMQKYAAAAAAAGLAPPVILPAGARRKGKKPKDEPRRPKMAVGPDAQFLVRLDHAYQIMEGVGHSLPLAILYYTSLVVHELVRRDSKNLLPEDPSSKDMHINDRKVAHFARAAEANASFSYSFKLTDFCNQVSVGVLDCLEKAYIAHSLALDEEAEARGEAPRAPGSPLSSDSRLSAADKDSMRLIHDTLSKQNPRDSQRFAHIIGGYLEALGVIEVVSGKQLKQLRRLTNKISPNYYKSSKTFHDARKARHLPYSNEAFFEAFPDQRKVFAEHNIPEPDGCSFTDLYSSNVARITSRAFSAFYLGLDPSLTLPMLVEPLPWREKPENLHQGLTIGYGGYLSNVSSLHRGVHSKSEFSYVHITPDTLTALNHIQTVPYYISPIAVADVEANFTAYLLKYLSEYFSSTHLSQLIVQKHGEFHISSQSKFVYHDDEYYFNRASVPADKAESYFESLKTADYLRPKHQRRLIYLKFINLIQTFFDTYTYARLYQGYKVWFTWYYDLRFRIYTQGYPLNPMGSPFNKFFLDLHPDTRLDPTALVPLPPVLPAKPT
jgi:hypothetical protein